jgi:hypothetical protein
MGTMLMLIMPVRRSPAGKVAICAGLAHGHRAQKPARLRTVWRAADQCRFENTLSALWLF